MGHHFLFSVLSDSARAGLNGEQRIGRGGPVNWPARSPDLNSLDSSLRGHVKTVVCSVSFSNFVVLQQREENSGQEFGQSAHVCAQKS
jgi:hypothetical protein